MSSPVSLIANKVEMQNESFEKLTVGIHCGAVSGVKLSIHLYQGMLHQLVTSDKPIQTMAPNGPPCRKVGRIRKEYVIPYFTANEHWQLKSGQFSKIMHDITQYDQLNGQTTPSHDDWTDAFSDAKATNSKFTNHWSPSDNSFTHRWRDTNVYAFPPMHDNIIDKTLAYHVAQQQEANKSGKFFRGVVVVPYKPHSTYWKYTENFQLLHFLRTGSRIFETLGSQKKMHTIASPTPMYVLYDQGYQQPDIHMAYVYAMEKCS